jgi:pimeloyl-ACP methyl ester carboxylesterase
MPWFAPPDQEAPDLGPADAPQRSRLLRATVRSCEDDQIVPLAATAPRTASMLTGATLKIYPGGSHGLIGEFEAEINHNLLNFIKA